ncbi:MAG: DUF167 domain-containing protein [Lentisphaeria bacterium]|jgi:uncharacterized protein (TIGR00251 family)|nr:DUF167 domain-containing protein [Lentisphaeria bacterium]
MLTENKEPLYSQLSCYVQPKSSRCAVAGVHDGMLKIALTAPPVDGEANKMLIKFIASELGVSKSSCSLVQGDTSRRKVVRIYGVTSEDVKKRLCSNVDLAQD